MKNIIHKGKNMEPILLSIVVPTKNREEYLKSFIDLYTSFDTSKTELVIQDNSDNKNDIGKYIEKYPKSNIVYNYIQEPMPVILNSELAILNSRGKYVCFMGDDDLLSKHIVTVVEKMDKIEADSVIFKKATYNWPGMQYKTHTFPNLIIPKFTGRIYSINPKAEYNKLLRKGATELAEIPQLYHGVIKRTVLDEIKSTTGTFFPGPSPDMAIAACLSCFVRSHFYIDAPIISSGKSPKSAAGLGAKHEHKGEIKTMSFLPSDIEEKWDQRLPFIWTGPTIYAQSAIEAIKAMGREKDLKKLNFTYFYAYFDTFCSEYKEQSQAAKDKNPIKRGEYFFDRICIFLMRAKIYIKNKLLLSFRLGGSLFDNVRTCVDAEKIIDKEIERKFNIDDINFIEGS